MAGLLLYAAAHVLPFVHGTVRLLVIPFSRTLTLPEFVRHLAADQPLPVVVLVACVLYVGPLALIVSALLAGWDRRPEPGGRLAGVLAFLRWRGWIVAGLGLVFTVGLRAASSANGGPTLRLLPGVWCFCGGLLAASAALALLAPCRVKPVAAAAAPREVGPA